MQDENDDKRLTALYQKRKKSISAPEITFPQEYAKTRSYQSWEKLIVALLGGCFASFSIFAIISHLSHSNMPPAPKVVTVKQKTTIEFEHEDLSDLTTQAVENEIEKIKKTALINSTQRPAPHTKTLSPLKVEAPIISETLLTNELLLQIKQPELKLQITHKVMPTLGKYKNISNSTGIVKLSYQVDLTGQVSNIKIVASSANKRVEKSAINALSQWQYIGVVDNETTMEIIFDFKRP